MAASGVASSKPVMDVAGGVWCLPGPVMAMAVVEVGAALFGACVGSFLNVVVHRLPQEDPAQRSLGGRSRCPGCGAGIRWFDNLPVLGWLLLRGRARCCGARISFRYPAVEFLTALLFWALVHFEPFAAMPNGAHLMQGQEIDLRAGAALLWQAAFVSILVACTFIDLDHFLLPDALTKPGMALGVAAGFWPGIAGPILDDPYLAESLRTVLQSLIGLLVGGGVTWAIRAVGSRMLGQEAMGLGDVKFLAMVGAFLGYQGVLLTLFLGCIFGAAVGVVGAVRGGMTARLPFGPYLALGALVSLFGARRILHFLFKTWPDWQRSSPSARWILPVIALVSLVLLFAILRRLRRRR